MAGYDGYSKSNNALGAESRGIYPLTQAIKVVANATASTLKAARAALKAVGSSEWHHTSKMYNETQYYNTKDAIGYILATEIREYVASIADQLAQDWPVTCGVGNNGRPIHALPLDERIAKVQAIMERAAEGTQWTAEQIESAYNECWEDFSPESDDKQPQPPGAGTGQAKETRRWIST